MASPHAAGWALRARTESLEGWDGQAPAPRRRVGVGIPPWRRGVGKTRKSDKLAEIDLYTWTMAWAYAAPRIETADSAERILTRFAQGLEIHAEVIATLQRGPVPIRDQDGNLLIRLELDENLHVSFRRPPFEIE